MSSLCTNNRLWLCVVYWVVGASILASSSTENNHSHHNHSHINGHETIFLNNNNNDNNNNDYLLQLPIDDKKMMTLTEQLRVIDGISGCSYDILCTTPTSNTRFFPNVPVGSTHNFAQLAKEKVDLVTAFVHDWKKDSNLPKTSSMTKDETKLITNILQTIKSVRDVRDVRFLIYFPRNDTPKEPHWLYTLKGTKSQNQNPSKNSNTNNNNDSDYENELVYELQDAQVFESEVLKFPWFVKPPIIFNSEQYKDRLDFGFNFTQDSSSHSQHYSHNSRRQQHNYRKGHNNNSPGPEFSYWTWPYFLCSKFNTNSNNNNNNNNNNSHRSNGNFNINVNTHVNQSEHKHNNNIISNSSSGSGSGAMDNSHCSPLEGLFLVSYTAGFHMYNQKNRIIYGILSFDVDLSKYDINQCGYESEEERLKDLKENPLHVFRGTHKCDINTTTCHFIPGRKWRQASYECFCKENRHAFRKDWLNRVTGRMAEMAYPETGHIFSDYESTEWNSYFNTVSCKKCPVGCENCFDGENCLADTSWMFRIGLLSVSMVSIACTAGIILIVYHYRKAPVLKSSSPIFHCIVLVGCIIMYTEMVALLPPMLTSSTCIAVKWTRHLGFGITYTALYMKLCRVYLTFRVKSAHKIKLTEKHLLHWMSPIMVIMLLYLTAWSLSDPPSIEKMYTTDGKIFIQCVYNWWDHCIAAGEVIFLSYGVWICYRIRSNADAQFISYAIYNIAIINILMVTVHLIILPQAGPDTKYLFAFIRTQMSTTLTIALVFGSKLYGVWGKPKELKEMPNSANGFGHDTLDLAEENQQLKEELQRLSGQLERLKVFAMGKNNPHLKQSSANISSADLEFNSNRLETSTFTTL